MARMACAPAQRLAQEAGRQTGRRDTGRMGKMRGIGWNSFNQERIVLALALVLFAAAAIGLPGFLDADNLISIVRSVSVLGILAFGMAIVIIGRGIDLSMVAVMAMSVAWYLQLLNGGMSDGLAFAIVLAGVIGIGALNGILVAYADVPAIFVTLASGSFVFGYVRIPVQVYIFAALAVLTFLFLRFTKWGRYVYFAGDNPLAARNLGMPVRPMLVLRYVLSALIAFVAGLLTAASLHSINTRIVNSNLLYDIVLVAVIGGIGLSGGRGGVRNVLVGAALIGILLNAMTIIDIPTLYQNLIKAAILLAAIVVDGILNPRDEQTAQQGDI
jgi:ribose transport system permease protein